jgi:hypothetical protein
VAAVVQFTTCAEPGGLGFPKVAGERARISDETAQECEVPEVLRCFAGCRANCPRLEEDRADE